MQFVTCSPVSTLKNEVAEALAFGAPAAAAPLLDVELAGIPKLAAAGFIEATAGPPPKLGCAAADIEAPPKLGYAELEGAPKDGAPPPNDGPELPPKPKGTLAPPFGAAAEEAAGVPQSTFIWNDDPFEAAAG